MKVKSVESKGQHVQVVKPFRYQDGSEAGFSRFGTVILNYVMLNPFQRFRLLIPFDEGLQSKRQTLLHVLWVLKISCGCRVIIA